MFQINQILPAGSFQLLYRATAAIGHPASQEVKSAWRGSKCIVRGQGCQPGDFS